MNIMRFICGLNVYDFYFIPTIRFETHCEIRYLTADWLKWYIGVQWEIKSIQNNDKRK